ncbi:MAG: hypothetical protein AAB676_16445 [Verrucomicrobiota bacterium]
MRRLTSAATVLKSALEDRNPNASAAIPHSSFDIHHSAFTSVVTNLNNMLKKTIIRLVAEVAGLNFGKDVIVDL